jgi:hypothetical protein
MTAVVDVKALHREIRTHSYLTLCGRCRRRFFTRCLSNHHYFFTMLSMLQLSARSRRRVKTPVQYLPH